KLGHDGKHCSLGCESQSQDHQYGEWLRAGSVSKGTSNEIKGGGSRSKETLSGRDTGIRSQSSAEDLDLSGQRRNDIQKIGGICNLENMEVIRKERHDGGSEAHAQKMWRTNEEGVISVGQTIKPNNAEIEVTSPLKTKIKDDSKENGEVELGLSKGKIGTTKGKWKKIAREIGKAHDVIMKSQELSVGMKRIENMDIWQKMKIQNNRKALNAMVLQDRNGMIGKEIKRLRSEINDLLDSYGTKKVKSTVVWARGSQYKVLSFKSHSNEKEKHDYKAIG
ncbi:hypothetical protein SO802_023424, partial [Lithocarpus litseifolius]